MKLENLYEENKNELFYDGIINTYHIHRDEDGTISMLIVGSGKDTSMERFESLPETLQYIEDIELREERYFNVLDVENVCPNCGNITLHIHNFCPNCGRKINNSLTKLQKAIMVINSFRGLNKEKNEVCDLAVIALKNMEKYCAEIRGDNDEC